MLQAVDNSVETVYLSVGGECYHSSPHCLPVQGVRQALPLQAARILERLPCQKCINDTQPPGDVVVAQPTCVAQQVATLCAYFPGLTEQQARSRICSLKHLRKHKDEETARHRRYRKTSEYRAARSRYQKSEHGRASSNLQLARYYRTKNGRAVIAKGKDKYAQTAKYKATLQRRNRSFTTRWSTLTKSACKRNIAVCIDKPWAQMMLEGAPCVYCDLKPAQGCHNFDRVHNTQGYTPYNVAPACASLQHAYQI